MARVSILAKLPVELLDVAIDFCDRQSNFTLALVCHRFWVIVRPALYRHVRLGYDDHFVGLRKRLDAQPSLFHHIRSIEVDDINRWSWLVSVVNLDRLVARRTQIRPKPIRLQPIQQNTAQILAHTASLTEILKRMKGKLDELGALVQRVAEASTPAMTRRSREAPSSAGEKSRLRKIVGWFGALI